MTLLFKSYLFKICNLIKLLSYNYTQKNNYQKRIESEFFFEEKYKITV
jgi:hypothetical protein